MLLLLDVKLMLEDTQYALVKVKVEADTLKHMLLKIVH